MQRIPESLPEGTCEILLMDDCICVVSKPPGLFVHPSSLDRRLPDCRTYLENKLERSVYNIHRIDRPASGLVLYALTKDAASVLSEQFRTRAVEKKYLAIVRGHAPDEAYIDYPIPGRRGGDTVPATSYLTCLSRSVVDEPVGKFSKGWFSLVEILLETGRPHQARRHLKHIGHPIIGDTQHGDLRQNMYVRNRLGTVPLCLRAYSLVFAHPSTQEKLLCRAGLTDRWREVLDALKLFIPPTLQTSGIVHVCT